MILHRKQKKIRNYAVIALTCLILLLILYLIIEYDSPLRR
jgi:hypothetical protein